MPVRTGTRRSGERERRRTALRPSTALPLAAPVVRWESLPDPAHAGRPGACRASSDTGGRPGRLPGAVRVPGPNCPAGGYPAAGKAVVLRCGSSYLLSFCILALSPGGEGATGLKQFVLNALLIPAQRGGDLRQAPALRLLEQHQQTMTGLQDLQRLQNAQLA